ncbi:MAG: BrnA antitoxin family protein [Candidatus Sumerlaeota bacterium]|nr:BrnA antitoxin family protein [Candidatus Sumerlaeota bacterium]
MSKSNSSETFDARDEYPKFTQVDFDRAAFRIGLKPAPRKQRVTILLDTGLVEYFKAKAGGRGYQTMINETLRHAMASDDLVTRLRYVIREEIRRAPASASRKSTKPNARAHMNVAQ